jgi:tRNA pseudouridine55 synthase
LIQYVHLRSKAYMATFLLGRQSETEDVEGHVVELADPPVPSLDQLREAAGRMQGTIMQRPPQFSALHVAGRRAYELARRGDAVDLAPRPITVDRLEILDYQYPQLNVAIECSSGTYVRSLGRDLAEAVGTAAVMSQLVRTRVAEFDLAEAVAPDDLSPENLPQFLRPPLTAVAWMPRIVLSPTQLADVRNGRPIAAENATARFAAVDAAGSLVAILIPRSAGLLGPDCVLPSA